MLQRLWQHWKVIAYTIGTFQSRVLLNVFYVLILAPFALTVKWLSDPLRIKRQSRSQWLPKETTPERGGERARRQF